MAKPLTPEDAYEGGAVELVFTIKCEACDAVQTIDCLDPGVFGTPYAMIEEAATRFRECGWGYTEGHPQLRCAGCLGWGEQ